MFGFVKDRLLTNAKAFAKEFSLIKNESEGMETVEIAVVW